ncbi:MAG: poly(R)-hydroxyalkanoic acid synthase (Pha) [Pseudomonadales bacterium]|jgi:polyhydroxyalkanoate synthase subunit PhaC|nr:poly(R)-hydroxyalkanoic acid synthase (Pha) [Pseudomonadales bacterium]HAG92993.1 poly(R)-hydroxyalkanoic acid synthase (Pha) [Gammaproteobacteria bacterium]MBI26948.1 poly(R)-hydroxyalkanoic acid synthase (Pha) [Pseudomonadales bacterium]HAU15890.1 poly(R)-hydroxyalkanoic acid synthase (Pha) [Gammaproteobacteria bacterium]HBO91841.1 poly(R)-hydroxyalkanoic acid synthase (Pha) [Gammaproteobacteria bacterium]|tara:strand:- start:820 stop:1899 length:1080 start_codon:yes stop_codon:yes gene_type:complete
MLKRIHPRRVKTLLSNAGDRVLRPHTLITAGKTPYDVVKDDGLVRLRHYRNAGQGAPRYATPLVIVPPLAINMLIYDWFPQRSFVKYFLQQGFDVYLIDWGSPTRKHAGYTLATYVTKLLPEFLQAVRDHSGKQSLSLHGWSMGGGFALCYQAYTRDPDIRNIVTVGTALDGHANGQIGRQYAALNRALKAVGINFRRVPSSAAYAPAWINAIGFKLSDPVSSVQGYVDLIRNLDDREFMIQHANQSAFMDNLEAYPGGVIRDWMYSVWLENEASRGYFTLGHRTIYLRDVSANLLALAGSNDKLANEHCCEPIMRLVGSEDKTFLRCPGGHTGILSGSRAPELAWPATAEWLSTRTGG